MSNKLNGFTVPNNMSPTQTKTEMSPSIESNLPSSNFESGFQTPSQTIDPKELVVEVSNPEQSGTSSSQAIERTRTVMATDEPISNRPIESELSYMASLQRQKLGGAEPSAGYGSKNLPFAG
jgi:hypothetical protein